MRTLFTLLIFFPHFFFPVQGLNPTVILSQPKSSLGILTFRRGSGTFGSSTDLAGMAQSGSEENLKKLREAPRGLDGIGMTIFRAINGDLCFCWDVKTKL